MCTDEGHPTATVLGLPSKKSAGGTSYAVILKAKLHPRKFADYIGGYNFKCNISQSLISGRNLFKNSRYSTMSVQKLCSMQ